jgi:hypothetical protein
MARGPLGKRGLRPPAAGPILTINAQKAGNPPFPNGPFL